MAKAPAKAADKAPDNNKRLAELERAAGRWGDPIATGDANDLASAIVLLNVIKAKINEMVAADG